VILVFVFLDTTIVFFGFKPLLSHRLHPFGRGN